MGDRTMNVAAGKIIFSEGDTGDVMYVVVRGLMQVYRDTTGGRVVLGKIEAGQFFGEMALIGKTTRSATVVALKDSTLAVYNPDELESLLASKPDVGARMIRRLVERLRETSDKLAEERGKRLGAW